MDEIISLYEKTLDPDFIGQDSIAQEIIEKSKKIEEEDYNQEKTTKYYSAMRWSVNYLSNQYLSNNDLSNYFALIRGIKDIKNTNNTFLIKLTDKLIGKLKKNHDLFSELEKLCEELINFCQNTNNISMKNRIETRLAEIYFINQKFQQALDLCNKVVFDLKRYEDNLGLIQLLLLESKIYYATNGISKAKASLTSVKTLSTKVYVEPKLQANIDIHAGILAAYEKDFNLAYSYFYEAFDVYNIPSQRRKAKALKAFQYMILSKIVGDRLDEVNNVVLSKQGKDYYGKEVEALRSIEVAVKEKSLKLLKDNIEKNKEFFFSDHVIKYHINNLHNDLLEKNLIKIIKPYSVVEIDFVAKAIGLSYQEVLNKLRQMILDKKINGILDQGRGSLIIYDVDNTNPYLEKSIETFKNLEKIVEALDKKVRSTNI
jgi:26S proteasome regulatory subunit N6